LRNHPQNSLARQSAAALCFRQGADRRAVDHYQLFLDMQPNSVDAIGALAWILATSNDDNVRDGETAVELARTWSLHTKNKDPRALNALAAAYAERGEFEAAIRTIQLAIRLAGSQNAALVRSYESRLGQYRNGQPYRRGPRQP
jgi:tetratricopeptide (TPR) repeat protein